MPPKLSPAQIDDKLNDIRQYVREHREELATRGGSCLKFAFAAQRNDVETRFYLFMYKNEERFTYSQRQHVQTFAMLEQHRGSGEDAERAVSSSAKRLRREVPGDEANSSALAKAASSGDHKTLLLQLKRPRYDASRSRRKLLEARPLFDRQSKGGGQAFLDSWGL